MKKVLSGLLILVFLSGCASMTTAEKRNYAELEDVGAQCDTVANPGTAAALNVLPGFGDLYLAGGNGGNGSSWGAFALDLLLWPYSVVWGIPQAYSTAENVNKKECVSHFFYTTTGKAELHALQKTRKKQMGAGVDVVQAEK